MRNIVGTSNDSVTAVCNLDCVSGITSMWQRLTKSAHPQDVSDPKFFKEQIFMDFFHLAVSTAHSNETEFQKATNIIIFPFLLFSKTGEILFTV